MTAEQLCVGWVYGVGALLLLVVFFGFVAAGYWVERNRVP